MALDIVKAKGNYLYSREGKKYLDIIGGISVCNVGHGRKEVLDAINKQANDYLHIMVYGELIQSPQTSYAEKITNHLPEALNCVYFTNSGAEATEGAMKLAKRVTGRHEIIACNNSYHGSTQGALSIIGDEYWRNAYRPLLPGIWHYDHNSQELIDAINEKTACVIIEPIQAEVGIGIPTIEWMQQLSAKCEATGTLLIIDEIQCGFGRTGTFWGFEHFNIIPDIILLGKALGGGMPLGAFVSSYNNMQAFTDNPVLGHITTFGGHPVSCAAGAAAMDIIIEDKLLEEIPEKEALFHQLLQHNKINAVRSKGLLMAVELENPTAVLACIDQCLKKGLFTDWFLFAPHCIRIAPPLTITREEIKTACEIITSCL
ncbi:MAG: aspartate aminotransferase family protein [Flavipsychrobacter sp.]